MVWNGKLLEITQLKKRFCRAYVFKIGALGLYWVVLLGVKSRQPWVPKDFKANAWLCFLSFCRFRFIVFCKDAQNCLPLHRLSISKGLDFNYHLQSVKEKMSKSVWAVKRLEQRTVNTMCSLWCCRLLSHRWSALLSCLAVCRTVSTVALQVFAGAMPWNLEAIRVTNIYKVKRRARVLWEYCGLKYV